LGFVQVYDPKKDSLIPGILSRAAPAASKERPRQCFT